jgi:hypothetical protein
VRYDIYIYMSLGGKGLSGGQMLKKLGRNVMCLTLYMIYHH